jgi:hypothetical protein
MAAGDLTQLELLDLCAAELGIDGVVLDIAHFPRHDRDYVAQVKKFCADSALTIAAVRDEELTFAASDALLIAAGLGAPYVLTRMPETGVDPVARYNESLAVIARAVSEAKTLNVTIAVRNVAGSLAADSFELGRLRKEADSAWLRFALDAAALEPAADERLLKNVVIAYRGIDTVGPGGEDPQAERVTRTFARFPGFLCLDYGGSEREREAVSRMISFWRRLLAEKEIGE